MNGLGGWGVNERGGRHKAGRGGQVGDRRAGQREGGDMLLAAARARDMTCIIRHY